MSDRQDAGSSPPPVRPQAWFEREELDYQEFAAGGVRTFAIIEGRPDAFPVILLHGLPGASFLWKHTISGMSRNRRLLVPDLPGWGRSRSAFAAQDFDWTPAGCARWLADLLFTQGVTEFDLVGHGVGAAIGLDFMRRHPSRVRRLALIQPSPWSVTLGSLGARIASLLAGRSWSVSAVDHFLSTTLSPAAEPLWKPYYRELLLGSPGAPSPRELAAIQREFQPLSRELREVWINCNRRKLAILGLQSNRLAAAARSQLCHQAEYHELAAGDFPLLDTPDQVRTILHDFLTD